MSGKKYIYNPKQANFFIEYGVKCIGTGINPSTGKMYWVFGYNDCQEAYKVWNDRKILI